MKTPQPRQINAMFACHALGREQREWCKDAFFESPLLAAGEGIRSCFLGAVYEGMHGSSHTPDGEYASHLREEFPVLKTMRCGLTLQEEIYQINDTAENEAEVILKVRELMEKMEEA